MLQEALDVTLLIDHLDVTLTRAQYSTILAAILDNFGEPWSVCPAVIEWPKPDPEVTEGVCRDPLQGRHTAQVCAWSFKLLYVQVFCFVCHVCVGVCWVCVYYYWEGGAGLLLYRVLHV